MDSGGPSQPPRSPQNRLARPIFPAPRRGSPSPLEQVLTLAEPPGDVDEVFHSLVFLFWTTYGHAMQWEATTSQ
jgi:hypothetical protein